MLLYISNLADVAKRPNAPDCDSGIRGFETLHPPHYLKQKFDVLNIKLFLFYKFICVILYLYLKKGES